MVNPDTLKAIDKLNLQYLMNWGQEVDYSIIPAGLTQEKLVVVLDRIVETGESILTGYNKIFLSIHP